jgi:hypothetical protein
MYVFRSPSLTICPIFAINGGAYGAMAGPIFSAISPNTQTALLVTLGRAGLLKLNHNE